jgi:hypothetical protein
MFVYHSDRGEDGHEFIGSIQRVSAGTFSMVGMAAGGEEDSTQSWTATSRLGRVRENGRGCVLRTGQNQTVAVHLGRYKEMKVDKYM